MNTRNSKNKIQIMQCADADKADVVRTAFFNVIGGEGNVRDIQWAPPGAHTINCHVNGKAKTVTLTVTEEIGGMVARRVREMIAAASKGTVKPWIDFDHEHGKSAGQVLDASWGGDDPLTGGVRLKVELSKSGLEAIQGKDYQAFSPEFLGADGKILDVGLDLGGLVNEPAFRTIQQLWAKNGSTTATDDDGADADAHNNQAITKDKEAMNKKLMQILAKLGYISRDDLDDADAIAELSARGAVVVSAKLASDYVPKSEHDTLKTKFDELSKSNAERVVAKAVADGRLLAKDADGQKLWTERITANSADAKLLESIAPAKVPAQVVKAKATDDAGTEVATGDEHPLVVKAKAIATAKGISESDALLQAAEADPEGYADFCDKLGKEEQK